MFTPLHTLFPRALKNVGMLRQAQAALVCQQYRKIAEKIIHPEAAIHTFPKFYQRKILTIGVENSSWAYAVMQQEKTLIKELNRLLGKDDIKKIQTKVETIKALT